jgi:hypothetical protein
MKSGTIVVGVVILLTLIILGFVFFVNPTTNTTEDTPRIIKYDNTNTNQSDEITPPDSARTVLGKPQESYSPPTVNGFTARPDVVLREVEKERVIALPFPDETVFPAGHSSNSRLALFMGLPVHPY